MAPARVDERDDDRKADDEGDRSGGQANEVGRGERAGEGEDYANAEPEEKAAREIGADDE